MATSKRDRQRANREAKLAEQQKVERKRAMFTRGRRIAIWVVIGAVLFIVANLFFGGSSDEAAAAVPFIAAALG
jgi:hypothetical protein